MNAQQIKKSDLKKGNGGTSRVQKIISNKPDDNTLNLEGPEQTFLSEYERIQLASPEALQWVEERSKRYKEFKWYPRKKNGSVPCFFCGEIIHHNQESKTGSSFVLNPKADTNRFIEALYCIQKCTGPDKCPESEEALHFLMWKSHGGATVGLEAEDGTTPKTTPYREYFTERNSLCFSFLKTKWEAKVQDNQLTYHTLCNNMHPLKMVRSEIDGLWRGYIQARNEWVILYPLKGFKDVNYLAAYAEKWIRQYYSFMEAQ